MNNSSDFRNNIDVLLKDIKVTDDLKKTTMKKCLNNRYHWIKLSILSSAAVIIFALIISNALRPLINIKNLNISKTDAPQTSVSAPSKETIYQEVTEPESNKALIPKNNISKNTIKKEINDADSKPTNKIAPDNAKVLIEPDETAKENINTSSLALNKQTPSIPQAPRLSASNPTSSVSGINLQDEDLIKKAEGLLGYSILLPGYIPEGYKLTDVSAPQGISPQSNLSVNLTYSYNNNNFTITECKKINTSTANAPLESSDIKSIVPDTQESPEIIWEDSNLKYTLTGNIPENVLSDIAKSIK